MKRINERSPNTVTQVLHDPLKKNTEHNQTAAFIMMGGDLIRILCRYLPPQSLVLIAVLCKHTHAIVRSRSFNAYWKGRWDLLLEFTEQTDKLHSVYTHNFKYHQDFWHRLIKAFFVPGVIESKIVCLNMFGREILLSTKFYRNTSMEINVNTGLLNDNRTVALTPFHLLIATGDLRLLHALPEGSIMPLVCHSSQNVLTVASHFGQRSMLLHLLQYYTDIIDPNHASRFFNDVPLLTHFSAVGDTEMVTALLSHPRIITNLNPHPVLIAYKNAHIDLCLRLIKSPKISGDITTWGVPLLTDLIHQKNWLLLKTLIETIEDLGFDLSHLHYYDRMFDCINNHAIDVFAQLTKLHPHPVKLRTATFSYAPNDQEEAQAIELITYLTQNKMVGYLRILAHVPQLESEKQIEPKICSWTHFFTQANATADKTALTSILKQRSYLSSNLMQQANCYPLHQLATSMNLNQEDKELISDLLASSYFDISDLNHSGETVVDVALKAGNIAFLAELKKQGVLKAALDNLSEHHDGLIYTYYSNLLTINTHVTKIILLSLEEFSPSIADLTLIKADLNNSLLPHAFHHRSDLIDLIIQANLRYMGMAHLIEDKNWQDESFYHTPSFTRCLKEQETWYIGEETWLTAALCHSNTAFVRYLSKTDLFESLRTLPNKLNQAPYHLLIQKGLWEIAALFCKAEALTISSEEIDRLLLQPLPYDQWPEVIVRLAVIFNLTPSSEVLGSQGPLFENLMLYTQKTESLSKLFEKLYTRLQDVIEGYLATPLGQLLVLDDFEPSESQWHSIGESLKKDVSTTPPYHLFTHAIHQPHYCGVLRLSEYCHEPFFVHNLKFSFMEGVLSNAENYPIFRKALIASSFFRLLSNTKENIFNNLFTKPYRRLAFALINYYPAQISKTDMTLFENYYFNNLSKAALEEYTAVYIKKFGISRLIQDAAWRKMRFYRQDAVHEVIPYNAAPWLLVTTILVGNELFFEYLLTDHSILFMRLLPRALAEIDKADRSIRNHSEFFFPAISKAIIDRANKPEFNNETKLLLELFERFYTVEEISNWADRSGIEIYSESQTETRQVRF